MDILGDINAHIGKDNTLWEEVTGKQGTGKATSNMLPDYRPSVLNINLSSLIHSSTSKANITPPGCTLHQNTDI